MIVLNQLLQFHEHPAVITWWNTHFERGLSWFTPVKRRLILATAAIYIGIKKPLGVMEDTGTLDVPNDAVGKACVILGLFALLWLLYQAAVHFKTLPEMVRRHPQLTLHLLLWIFLTIIWLTSPAMGWPRTVMIGIAAVFPFVIWRCGYMLQSGQQGKAVNTKFRDHLFYLWPAFGGSDTPYGKGHDYLSRCEAKNNDQLTRSQLSGFKLLLLSVCWHAVDKLMFAGFYGSHSLLAAHGGGIPELSDLVVQGSAARIGVSWASMYCEFFHDVLDHAAKGHQVIGILRLFGFNVFRNTYKPLYSESIVEFWNRYFYYFKEVMSNFFFMPTFMQLGKPLKNWPNVRLFCAVFAAAFVGNMYFHIIKINEMLVAGQVFDIIYIMQSRFFYCFLLAIGIFISMWRLQQNNQKPISTAWWARAWRMFGVWTFFSILVIWNVKVQQGGDFGTRMQFFFNLFGF